MHSKRYVGRRRLLLLFACLFVVMLGYGITLAVLPFFVERMARGGLLAASAVSLHVGLLTAAYPLMQLPFAPLWGRWSDRIGRKPLLIVGLAGGAATQALFALGTSLVVLYSARLLGGALSSAVLPVAAAYVVDTVSERGRNRGMAWMSLAIGLGIFAGPALSGLLTRRDWHFELSFSHWVVDAFSVPFLVAAAAAGVLIPPVLRWLPESRTAPVVTETSGGIAGWSAVGAKLKDLLALTASSQFGMALFMTTFALYAGRELSFGPAGVGVIFAICALTEVLVQSGIGTISRWITDSTQVTVGFGLMAAALGLLPGVQTFFGVGAITAVLAMGTALIAPNLLALISLRSRSSAGAALGLRTSAISVGQVAGPIIGSSLFLWRPGAPFLAAGAIMLASAVWFRMWGR